MHSIFSRTLLATLAAVAASQGHAAVAVTEPFPNAGPYTQEYTTVWFTEDISATTKLFQYAVINLGTAALQESYTDLGGNPQVIRHDWRTDTPFIKTYEVPILSAYAYGAIKQDTIQSPQGWSYRFIDTAANPSSWTNTTGDSRFDNPYRVMQWYVDDSLAPGGDLISHMEQSGIRPQGEWLTRDQLTDYMTQEYSYPGYGGSECGLSLWHEACYGKGFSFEAEAGKVLGPDQTSWSLVTRTGGENIVIQPLPPRIGDPDLPVGSNGLSFNGGIAMVAAAPVPEPGSYALMLAGLLGLAALRRGSKTRA